MSSDIGVSRGNTYIGGSNEPVFTNQGFTKVEFTKYTPDKIGWVETEKIRIEIFNTNNLKK